MAASDACPMEVSPRGAPGGLDKELESMLAAIDVKRDAETVRIDRRACGDDDLNKYSLLLPLSPERKLAFVDAARQDRLLSRAMGSMVGMAVGDALGHPFEFDPVQDIKETWGPSDEYFDLATMKFNNESNQFRLQRGQWTDDASMGLCMADSLIVCRRFHGPDMRVRFWCWWNRGYNNAFRKDPSGRTSSVGLGGNISKSLSSISNAKSIDDVPERFDAQNEDAGNGSLMRFTPVAIFMHACTDDMKLVHEWAMNSSYTTHPGVIAALACALLAHLIVRALQLPAGDVDVKDFLERTTKEFYDVAGLADKSGWGWDQIKELTLGKPSKPTEGCWAWREPKLSVVGTVRARGSSYNGYPVSRGYFGSYSLDGLGMALWSVYHSASFDEAVTRSVNLLGDADSHGSITGQLAGAIYGYDAINPQFTKWLTAWDDGDFAVKGAMLAHLGTQFAAERRRESL